MGVGRFCPFLGLPFCGYDSGGHGGKDPSHISFLFQNTSLFLPLSTGWNGSIFGFLKEQNA
jgi:hypothetical protein